MGTKQDQIPSRPEVTLDVTRGAARLLRAMGYSVVPEVILSTGRRVDLVGIDRTGMIAVAEVKSSPEDFLTDTKWQEYLEFCDLYYFAVSPEFPTDLLPDDPGLIVADRYGGEVMRPSELVKLNAARRKAMLVRVARVAADRFHLANDPDASGASRR